MRSASRSRRMRKGSTRISSNALRSRTLCNQAPMEGRDRDPLQLAAKEFLHGLMLKCGADRKLVTNLFGDTSYGNLY